MATVKIEVELSTDKLLEAVKQLSHPELDSFIDQVIAFQAQRKVPTIPKDEAGMLLKINDMLATTERFQLEDIDWAVQRKFLRRRLEADGFLGFLTADELKAGRLQEVPSRAGVYLVLREIDSEPIFLETSRGGWFKDMNPTVSTTTLNANWIHGAHVLYIGKSEDLRKRLRDLLRFGDGKKVAHWGGRYLWQVADCSEYAFAWKETKPEQTAQELESELLTDFVATYGARPFANLRD